MHITDIIRGNSPTFSFEFFPPKTPEAAETLYQTIRDLESYMPHFVSVTYGAGGSTRDLTHDLVERIQRTTKLDPIPHLTCVCHNKRRSKGFCFDTPNRPLEKSSRWAAIDRLGSLTIKHATRFHTRTVLSNLF